VRLNPIATIWRENFVKKLRERYGLAEEEARKKADVWLQRLGTQDSVSRPPKLTRPRNSRSRTATSPLMTK
jgi:hypothetical protein